MNAVITVKDFTQIWEAYAKFEDSLIAGQVSAMEEEDQDEEEQLDFDIRIARYENLIDRQPLLVNRFFVSESSQTNAETSLTLFLL
jgi:pre-mRNA-splicing factor SYF1